MLQSAALLTAKLLAGCSCSSDNNHAPLLPAVHRDLRRGQCKSTASSLPNGILVQMQWADPYAGSLEERYVCPEGDAGVLHVVSTISIGGTSITTTQVFRRHTGSKEALLQESEQRNGSAKDVLGRFGMKMPGFGMRMPGF